MYKRRGIIPKKELSSKYTGKLSRNQKLRAASTICSAFALGKEKAEKQILQAELDVEHSQLGRDQQFLGFAH